MKKNLVLITLFGIFCALPVFAANNHLCNRDKVDLRRKNVDASEFLYESEADYKDRVGYECDRLVSGTSDYKNSKCGSDAVKIVQPGHIWYGQKRNYGAVYGCKTGGNDYWYQKEICPENHTMKDDQSCEPMVGTKCSKEDLDGVNATDGVYGTYVEDGYVWCLATKCKAGKILLNGFHRTECYDPCTEEQLKKINATEGGLHTNGTCYPTKCESGYKFTRDTSSGFEDDKCVKIASDNNDKKQSNNAKTTTKKVGDACSEADLNERNAAAGKYIQVGNNLSCMATECKSGAYSVYKKGADMGWCVYPSYCKNGTHLEIIEGTKTNLNCISDTNPAIIETPDEEDFESPVDDNDDADDVDDDTEQTKQVSKASTPVNDTERVSKIIIDAKKNYEDLTKGLQTKKWRNKDGKFNTARLASDGVAGVVLGTTAGLITAHVVKKGQIKNGYEDIKCTIGGQEVSGWGDELTVGVR